MKSLIAKDRTHINTPVLYPAECDYMIGILEANGYTSTREEVKNVWTSFSVEKGAGWLAAGQPQKVASILIERMGVPEDTGPALQRKLESIAAQAESLDFIGVRTGLEVANELRYLIKWTGDSDAERSERGRADLSQDAERPACEGGDSGDPGRETTHGDGEPQEVVGG